MKYPKEQDIKALISIVAIDSYNYYIRKILFDPDNKIDWHKAYDLLLEFHPELVAELKTKDIVTIIKDRGGYQ